MIRSISTLFVLLFAAACSPKIDSAASQPVISDAGQVELVEGLGCGCDEEAIRAVQRACAAGFTPARLNGEPVRVRYIIPLKFQLQ